ncbi:MAG: glycosyltransferase [Thermoproteota archaeon]
MIINTINIYKESIGITLVFITPLSLDKHIELYSKSHLLLFPSRWESRGPPHVVLESLAAGMQLVAFDMPWMEILAQHRIGILVKPFNVNGAVQDVLKIYDIWISGDHQELSLKARETALIYNWKN